MGTLTYSETRALLVLISQELSYLQNNRFRHNMAGDPFGEVKKHDEEIAKWEEICRKLEET